MAGTRIRVLPMGERALLVETGAPASVAEVVRESLGHVIEDVVPAAATVLVRFCESPPEDIATRLIDIVTSAAGRQGSPVRVVELGVRYDGEDLVEVATSVGLTVDEVIDLHTAAEHRVDFCGFAPGFAYLGGLPEALRLPRRATPRVRVPAGSLAIAAGYSAVYPTASPGGWHLLGTTSVAVWDIDRDPPSLLEPGDVVRFRAL
jgi:KipI family sensor histidine kinase inhibitor